jgi:hypothetical protein
LIEVGLVTPDALAHALELQARTGRRLGALLVEQGAITAPRLTQMLSHQLSLPWVELERNKPPAELLTRIPRELAVRHRLIPIYLRENERGQTLYVATDDPTNTEGLRECSEHTGVEIRAMVAAPDSVSRALVEHYRASLSVPPEDLTPQPSGAVRFAAAPRNDVRADRRPAAPAGQRPATREIARAPGRAALPPPVLPPPAPARHDPSPLSEAEELGDDALEDATEPPVLVVNASRRFYEECAKAAQALGVPVRAATLLEVSVLSKKLEPLAMVVSEDVYAFDRVALNRLAFNVGAPLVIWSDDLEAEFLEPVLRAAQQRK